MEECYKSTTPPWDFFKIFKLYRRYQIVEMVPLPSSPFL